MNHSTKHSQAVTETCVLRCRGTLNGANIEIKVPNDWSNGTLVVHAHGYREDKSRHDGENDTSASAGPAGDTLDDQLLSLGYALAGSSYRKNGWAVEEGILDTLALTNHFSERFGAPSRTILWGFSMGSVVALSSIEQYPDVYDGAIAGCAIAAGSSMMWDSWLAFAMAYDVTFGWPKLWGEVDNVRNDLNAQTAVLGGFIMQVLKEVSQGESLRGKLEFIRLVTNLPEENFYRDTDFFITTLYFMTEGRAELEERAGGRVVQNRDHTYSLTDAQIQYLRDLGLEDPQSLVDEMNKNKIDADPSAREYLQKHADYTGNITVPVITLHTTVDGLIPVANETVYKETIQAAGNSHLLYQAYTNDVEHCLFSNDQHVKVLLAMDNWLETGQRPTDDDFPTDLGFVHNFEPPAWPFGI